MNTNLSDKEAGFIGTWDSSDFVKATTTLGLLSDAIDEKIGFAEVDKMIFDLDAIPTKGVGTGDAYMAEAINSGRLKGLIEEELKKRKRSSNSGSFLDTMNDYPDDYTYQPSKNLTPTYPSIGNLG